MVWPERPVMADAERRSGSVRIEAPLRTIVRVTAALPVIWLLLQLRSVFLLAAAPAPAVDAIVRRGKPPRLAVTAVVLALVAVLTPAGLIILIPRYRRGAIGHRGPPTYVDGVEALRHRHPALEARVRPLAERGASSGSNPSGSRAASIAASGVCVVAILLFALVLIDSDPHRSRYPKPAT